MMINPNKSLEKILTLIDKMREDREALSKPQEVSTIEDWGSAYDDFKRISIIQKSKVALELFEELDKYLNASGDIPKRWRK